MLRSERLFLDKNMNRTFLHALLMVPEGIKIALFYTRGQAPCANNVIFMPSGTIKSACIKVLFIFLSRNSLS